MEKARSSYAGPITCVRKKNGKLRICGDFRALNSITVSDHHTLPRIDYLKQVVNGQIFTTLDLKDGFYQIPITEADRHKTAISTPWGTYQYKTMPFRLRNAPPTFKRYMNIVLEHLVGVLIYIDDVIIFNQTYEQHLVTLRTVFKRLQTFGLTINKEKSSFAQVSVKYLGFEFFSKEYRPVDLIIPKLRNMPVRKQKKWLC